MDHPTFHPFPNLPWELRRFIWEAAVRPPGRAIHTFSVTSPRQVEGNPNPPRVLNYRNTDDDTARYFATVPESHRHGRPNRSVYLWDAGLWTACKESRQAIAHLVRTNFWRLALHEPGSISRQQQQHQVQLPITIQAPSMQSRDGEDWHLLVRPFQDAIRIDTQPMKDLTRGSECFDDWPRMFSKFPFPALDFTRGTRLIIDYDTNWHENWSKGLMDMRDFSPSSFFMGSLYTACNQDAASELTDTPIWLIDWGEYDFDPYFESVRGHVFYDCEGEYVEVGYQGFGADDVSAAHFILQMRPFINAHWPPQRPSSLEYCKVLRPRKLVKGPKYRG